MDTIIDTLTQFLETYSYTRWKNLFGYQSRHKDTHFFCGFIPREDRVDVLLRTTKSQQFKAKRQFAHAKSFDQDKAWTEVYITTMRELQLLQPFIDQAYNHVLTLKRDKDESTLKY